MTVLTLMPGAGKSLANLDGGAQALAKCLIVATSPNAVAYGSSYIDARDLLRSGRALDFLGVALWTISLYTFVLRALGVSFDVPARAH